MRIVTQKGLGCRPLCQWAEQDARPASCLAGLASYGVALIVRPVSYEPQMAYAVIVGWPEPFTTTIEVAVQAEAPLG